MKESGTSRNRTYCGPFIKGRLGPVRKSGMPKITAQTVTWTSHPENFDCDAVIKQRYEKNPIIRRGFGVSETCRGSAALKTSFLAGWTRQSVSESNQGPVAHKTPFLKGRLLSWGGFSVWKPIEGSAAPKTRLLAGWTRQSVSETCRGPAAHKTPFLKGRLLAGLFVADGLDRVEHGRLLRRIPSEEDPRQRTDRK